MTKPIPNADLPKDESPRVAGELPKNGGVKPIDRQNGPQGSSGSAPGRLQPRDDEAATREPPSRQEPEKGNDVDPRLKEPAGPGLYLSGMDEPGKPSKKNPGHTNPDHNSPGHVRRDAPASAQRGRKES